MTNHPNRSRRISQEARLFASTRETSDEVAQAILNSGVDAEALWADPSEAEQASVLAAAWGLAPDDCDELYWGGTHRRPMA